MDNQFEKPVDKYFDVSAYGCLGPIIFVDETKRKEWLDTDPAIRKQTVLMLHRCIKDMEASIVLDVMANVIKDFEARLIALEKVVKGE